MNPYTRYFLGALFAMGLLASAHAQYRCVEAGKTIFRDSPCPAAGPSVPPSGIAPKIIGDDGNAAYASPHGDWRGQIQFSGTANANPIPSAHTVVQGVISIDRQGKVTGVTTENGCKLSGLAIPSTIPTLLQLDVLLTDWRFSGFNRRFSGSLALYPQQHNAQLQLTWMGTVLNSPGSYFDIKGTLRR